MAILLQELLNTELFGSFPPAFLEILGPLFEIQVFQKDEEIFVQGQKREALYVIIEGEVDLVDSSLGWQRVFLTCGPGSLLAEPIVIEDESSYAVTARAIDAGRVARLSLDKIDFLRQKHPEIHTKMIVELSQLIARRLLNLGRGGRGKGHALQPGKTRQEKDLLGVRDVPANVLWGVQTLRATENFPISGVRMDHYPEMIDALAMIKRSCAAANHRLGHLDKNLCDAIIRTCDEIRKGLWHGHFVVDMIQGGAGTSANMNANEVIANRGLEILGRQRGDYKVLNPNDHVNMSQSTNDVYPSAIKIALLLMSKPLLHEIQELSRSFDRKGDQFAHILKMGRTQLQDAVPMSLGQEFHAWGRTLREGGHRISLALDPLREMNLGGTAIGTGINTEPDYAPFVMEELNAVTGLHLRLAEDLVEATQDTSSFVELAGVLKMYAVRLSKICNDLRLLSSGPRCGLNEINLPPAQPGSSIMPGKVNPVIPEVVNQVAFQVIGLDTAVALAAEGGQLELNVFEPLIAYNLFTSLQMLTNSMLTLRLRCIDGITANEDVCRTMIRNSIGIATALNPYLGYDRTSEVAKLALETKRSVYDVVLEKGYMTPEELDTALAPENMLKPSKRASKKTL